MRITEFELLFSENLFTDQSSQRVCLQTTAVIKVKSPLTHQVTSNTASANPLKAIQVLLPGCELLSFLLTLT